MLFDNGFSIKIVNTYIGKQLSKLVNPDIPKINVEPAIVYFPITYLGKQSFNLKNKLTRLMKEFYPQIKLRVIFKPKKTIQFFFRFKDKILDNLKSSVVYRYACSCCNATYIGKSKRHYLVRLHEHLGKSIRTNRQLGNPPFSAIRQHAEEYDHPISKDSFCILTSRYTDRELTTVETLFTIKEKPTLCNNDRSVELLCF